MKDLSTDQIGRLLVILRDNELIEGNEDIWKLLSSQWIARVDEFRVTRVHEFMTSFVEQEVKQ